MRALVPRKPLVRFLSGVLLGALLTLGAGTTALADVIPVGGPLVGPENPDVLQDFYVDDGPLTAKRVALAMRKGVAWLKRKQGRSGSWGAIAGSAEYGGGAGRFEADIDRPGAHAAGPTALALYALLRGRVPARDPVIRRGLCYLYKRHKRPASAFETSMVLLALTATAEKQPRSRYSDNEIRPRLSRRYRAWADDLRERLIERHGKRQRGWRYNYEGHAATVGGSEDVASTWLATLALFEAHRLGLRSPRAVWEDLLDFTLEQQDDDGVDVTYADPTDPEKTIEARTRGFAYIKGDAQPDSGEATGGMTACALATLEMARFVLSDGGRKRAHWDKRDDADFVQQAVFDGFAWLERNWQPFENPRKDRFNVNHGYWWFALEAATSLTAVKHIGKHAWFTETGQALVNSQRKAGHWETGSSVEPMDTLDTCFALLTLARNAHGLIPYPSVRGGRATAAGK